MPAPPPHDELLATLNDLASLQEAGDVEAVLRAAVVSACHATGSRRGMAGLCDGAAVTSDAWYDVNAGWTKARLRWEMGEGAPGRVCVTATPLLCNTVPCATDPPATPADGLRPARFACVPLRNAAAEAVGFIQVADTPREYSSRDVRVLAALAHHVTLRLHEVIGAGRRQAEEAAAAADIAERLQQHLLPPAPPKLADFDIAFAYRSASAGVLSGGDFVDYYSRSPNTLAFAIGDVAGKGVEAMAITFATKYILRAAVHGGQLSWPTNPGEALQELRTGLLEQPDFGAEAERFVTVLFGLVNARRGLLQLSSAGHPTPFVVRAERVERPLMLPEPAIGVELGAALAPYPTETIQLARGDVVVLFTDGIAELRNAQGLFFEDQMAAELEGCHDMPCAQVLERLMAAGEMFAARPPADDQALLCIRLTAGRGTA